MKPLEGLKVVELASFIAVPSAARMLSDWGAEVIKVEPLEGDYYRNFGLTMMLPTNGEINPVFTALNTGKKLVSLNLKSKEGIAALKKLIAKADVFMTNIRYQSIRKMGLGYEDIHKEFPSLVYFHFDGFGKKGPDADRPGFDQAAFWAYPGMTGDWATKGEHPLRPGHGFGDAVTSFNIASGILAAVFRQKMSGEGLYASTSLFASGIWGNHISLISAGAPTPTIEFPREIDSENFPFTNCYECSDGRWMMWYSMITKLEACLKALGRPDLIGDPRFCDRASIRQNKKELYRIIQEESLKHDSEYWDNILSEYDIVHCKLATMQETCHSEQAWANDYFEKVKYADGSEYIQATIPMEFSDYERPKAQPCGNIGADTKEVLKDFGYSESELDQMLASGIIK